MNNKTISFSLIILSLLILGLTTVSAAGFCGDGLCNNGESVLTCTRDCSGGSSVCGDGVCAPAEASICRADCMWCGDNRCNNGETSLTCFSDCGSTAHSCGNGICDIGETSASCSVDCPVFNNCGDGICTVSEMGNCLADCMWCGDNRCNNGETSLTCFSDCGTAGPVCGDSICAVSEMFVCKPDCMWCGDGSCNNGETVLSCSLDCHSTPSCGDGVCAPSEVGVCSADCQWCGDGTCNNGETSLTCNSDCYVAPRCGDGVCNNGETVLTCSQDCGQPSINITAFSVTPSGTLPLLVNFLVNATTNCGSISSYSWMFGDGSFAQGNSVAHIYTIPGTYYPTVTVSNTCGYSVNRSATVVVSTVQYCGDGSCNNGETVLSCSLDCHSTPSCGDGVCAPSEVGVCVADCMWCGDGTCNNGENSLTCSADCHSTPFCGDGVCAPSEVGICGQDCMWCGDGVCNNGETTLTCAHDCVHQTVCGDHICENSEMFVCRSDCMWCGDGSCNNGETVLTCNQDCVQRCGDGVCSGNETTLTCSADCNNVPAITVRNFSVTPTSGQVPFIINYFANATSVCGAISDYDWLFGNGAEVHAQRGSFQYITAGFYNLILTIRDSCGNSVQRTQQIIATPNPNQHAPYFVSIPVTSIVVDITGTKNYEYQASAIDPDGDIITYSLISPPIGMTINPTTGLINWTVNRVNVGVYHIIVVASDGIYSASQEYDLTVSQKQESDLPMDKVYLQNVNIINDGCVVPGGQIELYVNFENLGIYDMDNSIVMLTVPELNIYKKIGPFNVDSKDTASKNLFADVPSYAAPGKYTARISIGDEKFMRIVHRDFIIKNECCNY